MSYSYSCYSQTTTTTTVDGKTTTQTITSTSEGDGSGLLICEVSENELPNLSIESTQNYEISDDERLTIHDFYALMNSEDEEDESNSDSDIEDYWFPSLRNNSVIQLLDDKEEFEDSSLSNTHFLIEEGSSDMDDEEDEDEEVNEEEHAFPQRGSKRHYQRHPKKSSKKFRKSEQVPIDIFHISLQ
ncbi:hypothetical protein A0J61_04290 [Choanephora cucurbitarum]|uniref:Uncharacterized protein n=1 Tax=Choanephora cucurbitarum TaxID=101091 RepID=A0A1C7NFD7_9FUNG|nr:hypothetical protein A0J61_04290 [Choanephora cucurbitarum]